MKLPIASLATATMLALCGTAYADFVRTTPTCPVCVDIPSGMGGDFDARSITIKPRQAGTALVTFNGTLYCVSNNTNFVNFSLWAQIVDGDVLPTSDGPSALDISQSVEKSDGNSRVFAFNLATTRVVKVATRQDKTFRLRIHRFSIPENAGCSIRDGALTVHYLEG